MGILDTIPSTWFTKMKRETDHPNKSVVSSEKMTIKTYTFKNLPVKWQLGIGFSGVVAFFTATLLTIGFLITNLTDAVSEVNDISLPLVLAVDEMDLSRSEVQQFLTDVSATRDPDGYKDALESAKRFQEGVDKFKQHFKAVHDQAKLKEMESIETHFNAFYNLGKTMAETYVRDGMEAGNELMKGSATTPGFDQASEILQTQLASFRKEQIGNAKQASSSAVSSARSIQQTMFAGGLLACLLAAAISALIVRGLMIQLGGEPALAAQLAQRVGAGDLSFQIPLRNGDTSSLMAQLRAMQSSLVTVVSTVREEAQGVATASSEISQGNHNLSARTESQASALEETAASMEELSSNVTQNAKIARQANLLSHSAVEIAKTGGAVVAEVVETMQHINDSSSKIFEIISVIDGIAFQTNILALNAAVEAARAGEQGRGFAVVASEVRSLAGRSAEAAREVKTLINTSVERVEQGNLLVAKAGSTMAEVISSIRNATDIMDEITSNSNEQSDSVSQVSEAVNQMDQVTQQNAALVEQMAAAASSLRSQSDALVHTVSVFKL
ncbi:methyl-accepting chemotaxis protein [Malikia spinosa]|uniref:methyl-accepting chemotaxis protein n=1 Tax=Malikia spinosa TaxID=86180 RepID=UPI001FD3C90F|nr:methyl-accepting chemotaxis protein [Malikia spinosa]